QVQGEIEKPETHDLPKIAENEQQPAVNQHNDEFASKFAALTRREKKLQEIEQRLKEREQTYSKLEEAMKNKATNPMQLLEASGLTLDEILDFQLRQSENP